MASKKKKSSHSKTKQEPENSLKVEPENSSKVDTKVECLNCVLCRQQFTQGAERCPKMLPCDHTFCASCLQHRFNGERLVCPLDHQETTKNVSDLPSNSIVLDMLMALSLLSFGNDTNECVHCVKPSDSCCMDCHEMYCEGHRQNHQVSKRFLTHRIVLLSEIKSEEFHSLIPPAKCEKPLHAQEDICFFCVKCELPICRSCAVLYHDGHPKKDIQESFLLGQDSLPPLVHEALTTADAFDQAKKQVDDMMTAVVDTEQELCGVIEASFDERKKQVLSDLRVLTDGRSKLLRDQKSRLELARDSITSTSDMLKRMVEAKQGPRALILHSRLQKIKEGLAALNLPMMPTVSNHIAFNGNTVTTAGELNFASPLSTIEGKNLELARVGENNTFVIQATTEAGTNCRVGGDSFRVEVKGPVDCVASVVDQRDGTYLVTYRPMTEGKYTVRVTLAGQEIQGSPLNFVAMNAFSGTKVLTLDHQLQLSEWYGQKNWKLLYQGTRDGFQAKHFHRLCDNKDETLVVIKSGDNVFGGHADAPWRDGPIPSTGSSLFSLVNPCHAPCKLPVKPKSSQAMFGNSSYGPVFGSDLCICENSNTTAQSFTNVGLTYDMPSVNGATGTTLFTGARIFTPSEVEVFGL